jgi:hypothetical protein
MPGRQNYAATYTLWDKTANFKAICNSKERIVGNDQFKLTEDNAKMD